MPASPAQIAASRSNGLKSRGPTSPEGKAISRRNSLKHGMAGDGVVSPAGDLAEIERRSAAMLQEMRPASEMGRYLVGQLARLTVRVEDCAAQERASQAFRADHAEPDFDESRIAEVDRTLAWIATEPATHARKLRSMPEGVDRMIASLLGLREELDTARWDWTYGERLANLTGDRWMEIPVTRIRALSEAIGGDFGFLTSLDGPGLSDRDRADWARRSMAELIDAEVDGLLEIRETLDLEAIERDRAGSVARSGFDPSKQATLARRYEASAERGVFRTLDELRRVEAEFAASAGEPAGAPEGAESEEPGPVSGSFRKTDRSSGPPDPEPVPTSRIRRAPARSTGPDPALRAHPRPG